MIIFYIIKESFVYAINSLIINKLRTFLSLLGITIGIFAIITVFTVIDSLENSIKQSIGKLGSNVVYIQKWPWSFSGEFPWWKYVNRPVPQLGETKEILRRSHLTHSAVFSVFFNRTIKYKENFIENTQIMAVSTGYDRLRSIEIAAGRYFSDTETELGRNVVVLGYDIATNLFQNKNPIGKTVRIGGYKFTVIGVIKKEGSDVFGMSPDQQIHIPVTFARNMVNLRDQSLGPMIMVKAKKGVNVDELIDELEGIMRSVRRLKPGEEDDFSLNKAEYITQGFQGLFKILDITGIIIGGFSILVGGFGIANIMFVSVKEQTKIIGIQKAIGAKRYFILLQFLYEAVILSIIGGIVGLLLIFVILQIVSAVSEMDFSLSLWNVTLGLLISVTVGIIAGIVPAYNASRLNPVEAINSN